MTMLTLTLSTSLATLARSQSEDADTDFSTDQLELSQLAGDQRLEVTSSEKLGPYAAFHPSGVNYFWLLLQLPVTYDSNAGFSHSSAIDSDRFDPKLQFNFSTPLGNNVQLTDISAYDVDRYGRDAKTASETFQSILQFNYFSDGLPGGLVKKPPQLVPYFWYQPTLKYDSTFSHRTIMQNDVGGGISYKRPIDQWTVGIDLNFTRRFTSPSDSSSLWLKASVVRPFDNSEWVILFTPGLRLRWYDAVSGYSRRDEALTAPLILEWDPKALQSSPWLGDIQFSLFYTKNFSNGEKYRYQQWNDGPVPEVSWIDYNR